MSDEKYQLCPCGSGKKLKFCCYEKHRVLDRVSEEELFRRAFEFRVYGSHVNPNWQESGMAEVLVVRQTPGLKYILGAYLVDVFCLGLKNSFVSITREYAVVRAILNDFSQKPEEISYEDARSIILGAVEYARQLGFEPCEDDWDLSGPIVEAGRSFKRKFTFGLDGKPFYVEGPNDDPRKIMEKLAPLVKEGKADFLTIDNDEIRDALDTDSQGISFNERCHRIERELSGGNLENAQEEIEGLIDQFPGRWQPLFLMGTCLAMQGDAEQAIPFLEQAVAIHPSCEAYYNLAGVHRSVFHIREFVACIEKVIELDGANGEIGRKAKVELDAFASMICKTSGLTIDQYRENTARFDDAFASLMDGRYEEAIRGFNRVLEMQPGHVQSHGNLGLAYAGQGDRDRALRHLDKAIELDPQYEPAIDNRRLVLALRPGETLRSLDVREVDFYADKVRTQRSSTTSLSAQNEHS